MDLFWSGLVSRASEHAWTERKSQFSKIHETAIHDIKIELQERLNVKML